MSFTHLFPPRCLQTPRLVLRPACLDDAPALFAGYSGRADMTRFMNFPTVRTLTDQRVYLARAAARWESNNLEPMWAIMAREDARLVGVVSLRLSPPKADIGYGLCHAEQGKGYATEAAGAVVDWACAQPDIFRVWATCHPDNTGSIRVLQKLGFVLEGRLENWAPRPQLGLAASASLMFAKVPSTATT